jgi:hypothetical protein
VKERDDRLKFEDARSLRIFEQNNASISAARFAKKSPSFPWRHPI